MEQSVSWANSQSSDGIAGMKEGKERLSGRHNYTSREAATSCVYL